MKKSEEVLYHATTPENAKSIMTEGLKPTYMGNSIICMSPTPEAAMNFGDVVLRVDTSGYKISCFDDCVEWERFVWRDAPIPPDRITIVPVCPRCDGRRVVKYGVPVADKKRKCPKCKGTGLNDKEERE
ncbi:hypothetical protein LCGC14_1439710 [marine sediment metagenome]|uniref:Uncharacterized protein n=1 Tax=marine sediment metagenome TaxID=412755 RepID=A0A0F9MMZ4_9ZZZZ